MRKVVFSVASSLDHFIARRDGSIDWLMFCDEAAAVMKDFWTRFDTFLMGRVTWEFAMQQGHSDGSASGFSSIVFSRTLSPPADKSFEVVSEDAAEFVRKLKNRKGKDICLMGGGGLAQTLFEENLIDEVGLNVHPLLLGSGIPLFHNFNRQIDLELMECRPFSNGCVYVLYRNKP